MQSTTQAASPAPSRAAAKPASVPTWPILFVVGLLLTLSSFYLVVGGVDQSEFQSRTGMAWADVAASQPRLAGYVAGLHRTLGLIASGFALLGAVIGITAFRRGKRWGWLAGWIMAVVYAAVAAGMLANGSAVGYFYSAVTLLLVLAVVLPWRRFFPKG